MAIIYLSLGSNLGDRKEYLARGLRYLKHRGVNIRRTSSLYETEPFGYKDQAWFLNQVAEVVTELSPPMLLALIQKAEENALRTRTVHWGPRTLDIDILFYDTQIIQTDELIIPHPLLQDRRFVLQPLSDLAPLFVHPVLNKTVDELLNSCSDMTIVKASL